MLTVFLECVPMSGDVSGTQLEGLGEGGGGGGIGGGWGVPLPFFENLKNCPNNGGKCFYCVHP